MQTIRADSPRELIVTSSSSTSPQYPNFTLQIRSSYRRKPSKESWVVPVPLQLPIIRPRIFMRIRIFIKTNETTESTKADTCWIFIHTVFCPYVLCTFWIFHEGRKKFLKFKIWNFIVTLLLLLLQQQLESYFIGLIFASFLKY